MAIYRDILEELKADIECGRYVKEFPSEAQLVRRFNASRQTVIRAMYELVKEGLVERRRGSGTVVSRRVRHTLGCIGLLLPAFPGDSFKTVVANVCQKEGYSLLFSELNITYCGPKGLFITPESFAARSRSVRATAMEMAKAKVAGVLMQPLQNVPDADRINKEILEVFRRHRVPVVLIDCDILMPPDRSPCDLVCLDNFHAGFAVGRHLVERGARRVAFLKYPGGVPSVDDRLNGVSSAVVAAGLAWNPSRQVVACRPNDAAPISRMLRTFRPDAIVCTSDVIAVCLIQVLQSLSVAVPQQVRVAGFDDDPCAVGVSPALTTVRQDFTHVASAAANCLIWRMRHPGESPVTIQIHGELIVRASS